MPLVVKGVFRPSVFVSWDLLVLVGFCVDFGTKKRRIFGHEKFILRYTARSHSVIRPEMKIFIRRGHYFGLAGWFHKHVVAVGPIWEGRLDPVPLN
jgi:hypothetical protein